MKTSIGILLVVVIFFVGNYVSSGSEVNQQVDETFINISALEVKGSFLGVEIIGTDNNTVHFTGELTSNGNGSTPSIEYEVRGETLLVWLEKSGSNGIFSKTKGKLYFEVPNYIELSVKNSSGGVSVKGLTNNDLSVHTSSGGINASDLSGKLDLKASSGGIRLHGMEGMVNITTSSGGIKVTDIEGNVNALSSSGGQSFENIEGTVKTTASSGSVRFTSIEGAAKAKTSSGSIKVRDFEGKLNLTSSSGSQYGEDVELKSDSEFHSVSGSITMHLDNNKEDLRFDLSASSGSLRAFGNSGDKSLEFGSGKISIEGHSSSGSQKYD